MHVTFHQGNHSRCPGRGALPVLGDTIAIVWVVFAVMSAVFAGIMSILAKAGVRNVDSTLATALRTIVVLVFAWLMVWVVGSWSSIGQIDLRSLIFLILSGLATGASWLCYFKALQIGDANKVVPVDKSSTVLTMLLAFVFLGEGLTVGKAVAMVVIGLGTYLMIDRRAVVASGQEPSYAWSLFAGGAALFASLTALLAKVGITNVESNLGTAIRTCVVLVMAWAIVFIRGTHRSIREIDRRSWVFLGLSGVATGLSWLCFFRALQEGPASVVVPIDKLSIVITVVFGWWVLRERLTRLAGAGLVMIVVGTVSLLFM